MSHDFVRGQFVAETEAVTDVTDQIKLSMLHIYS